MGLLVTAFFAYFGVFAGVLLGSFTAEELFVGRYRLRIVQLILMTLFAATLLYEIFAHQMWLGILFLISLLLIEVVFLFDHRISKVFLHPRERTLFVYGILAFIVMVSVPGIEFVLAVLVFLYGLVTGSLIAEPYVEDRHIVPWDRPYIVAFKWTWTYLFVWLVLAFIR